MSHDTSSDVSGAQDLPMDYSDYLHLPEVLGAQNPLSGDHHEMLFIVQHQAMELWMRLALHELTEAQRLLSVDEVRPAFKGLARVSRVMEQLVHAWDVLSTLTPTEYDKFRPYLATGSGFQSWQYRCIEFALGNKAVHTLRVHEGRPHEQDVLAAYGRPSLYDESLRLLSRRGFDIPESHLTRDWKREYAASEAVEAAWREVYRDPEKHWDLYELGEELTDLETAFRVWRFRHVTTVERIIGFKPGTGGTSGVGYLRKQLDIILFPELWAMRTGL
ncbi:tryptophan 2,3-dioxygenase family protein [Nocardioides sp.]|uniref:tryptophan 2,3-dioxygenase n=1 Tax=Nocardioides sp. TaxID=35761 RepID=UPI0019C4AE9B|nr:tryptophan 2,3-dioxygenase family protein [Nocardioides sp.]MBC7276468.1 tryptophan 2,3-dioxygenase [Nocardioides sp.]